MIFDVLKDATLNLASAFLTFFALLLVWHFVDPTYSMIFTSNLLETVNPDLNWMYFKFLSGFYR